MQAVAAALHRGDTQSALQMLAKAEADHPGIAEIPLNLALIHRRRGDVAAGLAALDRVLALDPLHFLALLSKAALLEQSVGTRRAAQVYRAALRLAPKDQTPPAAIAEALLHARDVVQQDAADLHAHLRADLAPLRAAHAGAPLDRFDESLGAYAGTARIYQQRPLLLHYGRLPAIPFHDRADFPFLAELEAATDVITDELNGVLASSADDFAPYIQYPPGTAANQFGTLNHSRQWSSYFLWRDGVRHDEACRRCPRTSALVDRLPLMRQPRRAPTVVFSALEPHTHIPPHTGSSTTRLLIHLPLILPGPARFRVANEVREWRRGEAWVFDDTIEHEAWNDADQMRVILILDVWNPLLSQAERELITAMMAAREAYYADPPGDRPIGKARGSAPGPRWA